MCGRKTTLSGVSRGSSRRQRFRVEYVQTGSGDLTVLERVYERGMMDNRAARRVDEHGGWLHTRQFRRADQMARFGSQGSVERDKIAFGQATYPTLPASRRNPAPLRRERSGCNTECSFESHTPAAPFRTRYAPCRQCPVWRDERPARPAAWATTFATAPPAESAPTSTIRRAVASSRPNARSAVVSVRTPGVLPTAMFAFPTRRHVYVVHANRHLTDHAQLRRIIQQFAVNFIRQQAQQSVHIPNFLHQHVTRNRPIFQPNFHFRRPSYNIQRLSRQLPRNVNLHFNFCFECESLFVFFFFVLIRVVSRSFHFSWSSYPVSLYSVADRSDYGVRFVRQYRNCRAPHSSMKPISLLMAIKRQPSATRLLRRLRIGDVDSRRDAEAVGGCAQMVQGVQKAGSSDVHAGRFVHGGQQIVGADEHAVNARNGEYLLAVFHRLQCVPPAR